MRLMIIRHGDPDYDEESLTPTGWREAEALSERMKELPVTKFYGSPLGRAKDTASLTLQKMGREAEVCTWLREFCPPYIKYPSTGEKHICWDWLPEDWMTIPEFFDHDHWMDHPAMQESSVGRIWQETVDQFDLLLASHGYRREGKYYRAENRNRDLIVFFCHFGLECVLLSHLLNVSPMVLWHGTAAAPTSVTTLYTEERREGIASFRMQSYGDVSHLLKAGMEPSFAARFCETWDDWTERH